MRLPLFAAPALLAMTACDSFTGNGGTPADAGQYADASVPDAATPDAATPDAATPDAATPDGGSVVSCASVKNPILCLDFDSAPSNESPDYGFSSAWTVASGGAVALERSKLANAGNAIGVDLLNPPIGDHSTSGTFVFTGFENYPTLVIDADVTVTAMNIEYAELVSLQIFGPACNHIAAGIAVEAGSVASVHEQDVNQLVPLTTGVPFHVHLEAGVHDGQSESSSVTVGGQTMTYTTNYEQDCAEADLLVGAFYTSTLVDESIHVQFDQLVMSGQ